MVFIRCYGIWTREVALALLADLKELVKSLEPGVPWATLVDFSSWRPAGPEVADVAIETRELIDAAGRTHGAFLFGSLEAAKLMVEKGVIDPASRRVQHFKNEALAREWLASLGYL